MNFADPSFAELQDLLEQLCEGQLARPDAERLEALIVADPRACQYYLNYLHLHGTLQWDIALSAAKATVTAAAPPQASLASAKAESGWNTWGAPLVEWFNRASVYTFVTAAAVLLMVVTLLAVLRPGMLGWQVAPRIAASAPPSTAPRFAARLRGVTDCVWAGAAPTVGDRLIPRQTLRLRSGVAEVVFERGARVLLQAPAAMRIDSANRLFLEHGRLTARAEGAARGFIVHTNSLRVVDLGTEFAVETERSGRTGVHVFAGKVRVEPRDAPAQVVHRDAAVVFDPADAQAFQEIAVAPERFARVFAELDAAESTAPPVPSELLFGSWDGSYRPDTSTPPAGQSSWTVFEQGDAALKQPSDTASREAGLTELWDRGRDVNHRIQISRIPPRAAWGRGPGTVEYRFAARLKLMPPQATDTNAPQVPVLVLGFRDEGGQGKTVLLGWFDKSASADATLPGLALVDHQTTVRAAISPRDFFDGAFHDYEVWKFRDQSPLQIQVFVDGQPQFSLPPRYADLPDDEGAGHGFGLFGSSPSVSQVVVDFFRYEGGPPTTFEKQQHRRSHSPGGL